MCWLDMAGDEQPTRPTTAEDRLLRRLRLIAGVVFLVCIVLLVVVDTVGKVLIGPDFHASDLFLGTLIGALLLILGIETVNRLPGAKR